MSRSIIKLYEPTNYFKDFINKIQLNPYDYNSPALIKFHEVFQKEFYDKDGINKVFVLTPYQLQVAYVLKYMYSRYNEIRFNPKLEGDTVNGKMTFIDAINHQGDKESVFIKFQVRPTADDIRVDGLNAFILNMLAPNSPHFMEYHDMFRTLCLEENNKYLWDLKNQINNGKLIVDLDIIPITDTRKAQINTIYTLISNGARIPFVLPYKNGFLDRIQVRNHPKNENIVTAFAATRIHGASLHDCLKKVTISRQDIVGFLYTLYDLFRTLYSLRKVGFIHNDAHNCNILWDKYKHSFCLIDYGRSSVDVSLLQNALKYKIEEYTEYVLLNTEESILLNFYDMAYGIDANVKKTYEEFVHVGRTGWISESIIKLRIPDIKKQKLFKKWMVMFDILTITLGSYGGLRKPVRIMIEDEYYQSRIFKITNGFIDIMVLDDLLPIVESPNFLLHLSNNNLQILLPGILWLSLVFTGLQKLYPNVLHLFPKDPSNPDDYSIITASRIALADNHILYTSFQCLYRCCHPNICDLIPRVAGIIETLFPNSMYTGIRSSNSSVKSNSSMHTSSGGDKSKNSILKDITKLFDSLPDTGMKEAYTKYNRVDPPDELKTLLKSYKVPSQKMSLSKPKQAFNMSRVPRMAQAAGGMVTHPPLEPKYEELIEKLRYYKPF